MASTTTSITTPKRGCAGFTLVEIIVGSTISTIVLAGVLSTFLMLGRSGTNIVAYTEMDNQTRKGLEEFAQDVRMASAIVWNSATSLTLTVPENYSTYTNQVTYTWDATASSPTYRCFYRQPGNTTATYSTAPSKNIFVRNVTSFIYNRYDRLNAVATTDAATKRIQINMKITTTNRTVVAATDTTLSASFVLRNKTSN